jgi:hypothetical protein
VIYEDVWMFSNVHTFSFCVACTLSRTALKNPAYFLMSRTMIFSRTVSKMEMMMELASGK